MSQQLDSPVLAVFSTSRSFYGLRKGEHAKHSDDPTAYLAAAKESGDVEYDCAALMFLDIDQMSEGLPKPARIAVSRTRVGSVGFAGCRAYLDVGKWVGDQSAAEEMTAEYRNTTDADKLMKKRTKIVYDRCVEMEGRSKTEAREGCGLKTSIFTEIFDKLRDDGYLARLDENEFDELGRSTGKKRAIIKVLRPLTDP
jgi:hypothetical protein